MRIIFGALLFIGSVLGVLVSFSSNIVVNSSVSVINGMEMSLTLGVFFVLTALGGLYMIVSKY